MHHNFDPLFLANVKRTQGDYCNVDSTNKIRVTRAALVDQHDAVWTLRKRTLLIEFWEWKPQPKTKENPRPGDHDGRFYITCRPDTADKKNKAADTEERKVIDFDWIHGVDHYGEPWCTHVLDFSKRHPNVKLSTKNASCVEAKKYKEEDNRQIVSLRYVRETNEEEAHYLGLLKHGMGLGFCTKPLKLTQKYVEETFDTKFVKEVKKRASSKLQFKRYHKVPAGNYLEPPPFCERVLATMPTIRFRQHEGERTCMLASLCSALHWLGLEDDAMTIFNDGLALVNTSRQEDQLRMMLLSHFRGFQAKKIKYGFNIFDISSVTVYPRVLTLLGSDGGVGHAVTVCGGYLFDSNCDTAMLCTKEALDWCCMGEFVTVKSGFEFYEQENKKYKRVTKTIKDTTWLKHSPKKPRFN